MSSAGIRWAPVFTEYPEILAGTSWRRGGVSLPPYESLNLGYHVGDERRTVATNRERFLAAVGLPSERIAFGEQVHGKRVQILRDSLPIPPIFSATDGFVTDSSGITLAILTADCVPLFVYAPRRRAIGLFHTGWRGVWKGILSEGIAQLERAYGADPAEIHIAFGPGIGPCCYEVSPQLADQFFGSYGESVLRGTRHLDLFAVLRAQALAFGILPTHIGRYSECTACHTDRYFSHRASGGTTGRMLSFFRWQA